MPVILDVVGVLAGHAVALYPTDRQKTPDISRFRVLRSLSNTPILYQRLLSQTQCYTVVFCAGFTACRLLFLSICVLHIDYRRISAY